MPKFEYYSKVEDYDKRNENFNISFKEIKKNLQDLDNLNQLNKIYTFFIKLKEEFVKENLIDCLYILRQIAETLGFNHLKTWINFELNGYEYNCSYIPQYRRFLGVYFNGDIQHSARDDVIIRDPISEILRKIENKEDYTIELNDDDNLIFFHVYDKYSNKIIIFYLNLTQIAHGIKPILFDVLWILDSKIPLRFKKKIPLDKKYIKIELNNELINDYGNLIYLINLVAQNKESYNLIPFLLRKLFENLIFHIFQKALNKKMHKNFYFHKNRPRSFSKLIKLFNFFKNEELMEYHNGAIDKDLTKMLKLIRSKGNLSVHQLHSEFREEQLIIWEDKVNNLLRILFSILVKIPENEIFIDNEKRLNQIDDILKS